MVEIKYFRDATKRDHESYSVERIADFLKSGFSRDELMNMRFFSNNVLDLEIDTEDGSFVDIDEGVVVVIDGRTLPEGPETWIPILVGVLFAVAAVVLTPKPEIPDVGNRKQQSATNSLSASNNEPRINERIDDIFGYVRKHVPPLWQYPYRIGINNQEVEVMLLCVGRGKYDVDLQQVYDGDTPYFRIPNSQVNIYEPGTHPGKGSPSQTLGGLINQDIGIYRESNDLNASELLPPNDLALGEAARWTIVESSGNATLTLTNAGSLGVNLQDYFVAGENVRMTDCFAGVPGPTKTLHRQGINNDITEDFATFSPVNISGTYEITAVTSTTMTISGFGFTGISSLIYMTFYRGVADTTFYTSNSLISEHTWFETYHYPSDTYRDIVSVTTYVKNPDVGQAFSNIVGPINIPTGSDKILINLTSASGFYKLYKNNEKTVSVNIQITFEELDSNGDPTGTISVSNHTYSSNSKNTRYSVYKTIELDVPYAFSRVYARRTTNRDKGDNVSNVDKVEWTLLYSFEAIDATGIDFGDVTLMHCLVPSNSQSRLTKERRTNLDLTRKITQYLGDGQFGPVESYATDDFSQIMIHTALDPFCGRLNLNQINADGFLLLRQQIIDYFGDDIMTRFGYDFDNTQVAYDDMYTIITNVVNCIPYVQNGVYDAFFERRQDTSSMQITHRNKLPDSETVDDNFDIKYDGVELTYRNRDTGISEVIYIPQDQSSTNPERLELPGCTTELQAYRRALRLYYKQIYQVKNVQFDVDEFGRMIVPGQRIDSPDGTRFVRRSDNNDGYRVYDGEVVEVDGLTLELSEPVYFVDGEEHYIQFTNDDGYNSELILCTPGSSDFEIVLSSLPVDNIYDGYERDKTKFTFCSAQVRESIALIPQTIESRIDDGQEINTVSSINYDARYYQGDTETL